MNLRDWAEQAKPGERIDYTAAQRAAAYELFNEGKVILFQERHEKGFLRIAQRCSDRAKAWLDRMSAATPAPYNRWAHGYEGD